MRWRVTLISPESGPCVLYVVDKKKVVSEFTEVVSRRAGTGTKILLILRPASSYHRAQQRGEKLQFVSVRSEGRAHILIVLI